MASDQESRGAGFGRVRVRFFGHSSMTFVGEGEGDSLLARTASELRRLRPDTDWQCDSDLLYISPSAARYAERLVAGGAPDVALVRVSETVFMQDYVVYRLRQRWPSLYRAAVRLSEVLIKLAGGGPSGAPEPRGWLFRAPRSLAARLIGAAPEMEVEDAVTYTNQTLDVLLRSENAHVVLVTSSNSMPMNIAPAAAKRRRSLYLGEMRRYCTERAVLLLDPVPVAASLGTQIKLGRDRWHEDAEGRSLEARMYAQAVVQALEGRREFEFAAS